ncbi:unnamed protein product [Bursaphelenchus okinawaensis]|uniref:CBFD_NFYB_HMF domain-containing protein n=1 Tax=Bursaphelenchus okinawaensis TaxID=465554 RepID=A0A811KB57_9BILA|nr:unnamed protein product [Bursaphelenchus okinawaensis]CAG9100713.1 unnamed protein product [Bursaphelenchus okinawaensis]
MFNHSVVYNRSDDDSADGNLPELFDDHFTSQFYKLMITKEKNLMKGCRAIVKETTDLEVDSDATDLIAQFAECALKVMVRECCIDSGKKNEKFITYDTIADVVHSRQCFEPLTMQFPKKIPIEEVKVFRQAAHSANWTKFKGKKKPKLNKVVKEE